MYIVKLWWRLWEKRAVIYFVSVPIDWQSPIIIIYMASELSNGCWFCLHVKFAFWTSIFLHQDLIWNKIWETRMMVKSFLIEWSITFLLFCSTILSILKWKVVIFWQKAALQFWQWANVGMVVDLQSFTSSSIVLVIILVCFSIAISEVSVQIACSINLLYTDI